jgi:hypothetical protein
MKSPPHQRQFDLSALCRDVQSLHAEHHPRVFKMPQSDDFAVEFSRNTRLPDFKAHIAEEGILRNILCRMVDRPENAFTIARFCSSTRSREAQRKASAQPFEAEELRNWALKTSID